MNHPTRTKVNLGLGFGLTFLALATILSVRESVQSIEAARWVNRTHEVLEQVGTILSLVLDGEAARRGYVPTDQELLTEQGKRTTDQIRRLTAEMQQKEGTLLIERAARSQASARTVVSLIALGSLLSLLMVSVSLLMVNLDMSKRKRAENALDASEECYRDLFENADDIIFAHDGTVVFTSINKAGEQVTGYSREELLRMRIFDILAPGGFYQRIMAEGQTIFTDRNRTAEIIVEGLPGPLGPLASRLAALLRMEQGIAARLTAGGETHGVLLIAGA